MQITKKSLGDAINSEIEKAKNKGLTDYLTKPINPSELYETLDKY